MDLVMNEEKQEFDIVEMKEWRDRNTGAIVVEEISHTQETLTQSSTSIYYGKMHLDVGGGQQLGVQFIFPEEYTLLNCFENFKTHADEVVAEMRKRQEDQERSKIYVPGGGFA